MSEEKKSSWGDATTPRVPQRAAAAEGGGAPTSSSSPTPQPCEPSTNSEPGRPARPRHQHVLPGILGKQLRAAYGELLNAPVPDSITDLIKQLENQEAGKAAGGAREEEGGK